MKNSIKRTLGVLMILLTISLAVLALSSCKKQEVPLTRQEIEANISESVEGNHKYALNYLKDWGIPTPGFVYQSKIKNVEKAYHTSYYKSDELPSNYELAKKTANLFLEHFYEKEDFDATDESALTDAIIFCYVESIGDDYSVYRTPTEDDDYTTDMSGSFVGIGVGVIYSRIDNTITVTEVYPSSGAADAGILPGDLIVQVDEKTVQDTDYSVIINSIRGEEGTRVTITILRGSERITLDVERRKVIEQSVSYSINEENVGYIKITSFKDNTAGQFKEAVDALEEAEVKAVIYDLRSNGGGYLHAVVEMLDYIAPQGTKLVSFSNGYGSPIFAYDEHTFLIPSVVICNEYTASAGELFTSAIRDFSSLGFLNAKLVGVTTFGKGIMQSGISFTDGSSLTFTVAYYNPPSGVNYHGVGISPDIEIELSELYDNQLEAAYEAAASLIN